MTCITFFSDVVRPGIVGINEINTEHPILIWNDEVNPGPRNSVFDLNSACILYRFSGPRQVVP